MPKAREDLCPECGTLAKDPYKAWELVAPFPDKKMRITVRMFGMYECLKRSRKFKGVVSKAKLGIEL